MLNHSAFAIRLSCLNLTILEDLNIHRIQQRAIRWLTLRIKIQVSEALHQLFNDFQPNRAWSQFLTFRLAASTLIPPNRLAHIFPTTSFINIRTYHKDEFSQKNAAY